LNAQARLWFAADFHNDDRSQALFGTLSQSFVTLTITKMKSLMKRQAYLNSRDGACVHLLNSVHVAPVEENGGTFADFDARWETAAMRLWEPLPVDMNPSKKRKSAMNNETESDTKLKQMKLTFSKSPAPRSTSVPSSAAGAPP
jgi:hypothetical protein